MRLLFFHLVSSNTHFLLSFSSVLSCTTTMEKVEEEKEEDVNDENTMEAYNSLYTKRMRRIVQSYFYNNGVEKHHLESFNYYVTQHIPKIIAANLPLIANSSSQGVVYTVELVNISITKPTMVGADEVVRIMKPKLGHQQRQTSVFGVVISVLFRTFRNLNHPVTSTVAGIKTKFTETLSEPPVLYKNMKFFQVPAMAASVVCHTQDDQDHPFRKEGTFQISGRDRVMALPERWQFDYPFVYPVRGMNNKKAKYAFHCQVRGSHVTTRSSSNVDIYMTGLHRLTAQAKKTGGLETYAPEIAIDHLYVKNYLLPVIAVFRVFGVDTIDKMLKYIITKESTQQFQHTARAILMAEVVRPVPNSNKLIMDMTQDEVFDIIGINGSPFTQKAYRIRQMKHLFFAEFFPQFSCIETPAAASSSNRTEEEEAAMEMLRLLEQEEEAVEEKKKATQNKKRKQTSTTTTNQTKKQKVNTAAAAAPEQNNKKKKRKHPAAAEEEEEKAAGPALLSDNDFELTSEIVDVESATKVVARKDNKRKNAAEEEEETAVIASHSFPPTNFCETKKEEDEEKEKSFFIVEDDDGEEDEDEKALFSSSASASSTSTSSSSSLASAVLTAPPPPPQTKAEKATNSNMQQMKAVFFGYCLRKLIRLALGEIPADDVDDPQHKRPELPGNMFGNLTRQHVRTFFDTLKKQINSASDKRKSCNEPIYLHDFFKEQHISDMLRYACATGVWSAKKNSTAKCSVVMQDHNDNNVLSEKGQMRLTTVPLRKEGGKHVHARQLHPHRVGDYCIVENTEGKVVGLVNCLSLLAGIRLGTTQFNADIILLFEKDMNMLSTSAILADADLLQTHTLVMLNGVICGVVADPLQFVHTCKEYRRTNTIPIDAGIAYLAAAREVHVTTDNEECFRPLVCLDKFDQFDEVYNKYSHDLALLFPQMLAAGVIQNVTQQEALTYNISSSYLKLLQDTQLGTTLTSPWTHVEINPAYVLLGIVASSIPFPDFNQSPRNTYGGVQSKQQIGTVNKNIHARQDKKTHILMYPTMPLAFTDMHALLRMNEEPGGQMVRIGIMPKQYNLDDAIVMSQRAVDTGVGRSLFIRHISDKEVAHGGDDERFTLDLAEAILRKNADWNSVDASGTAAVGATANFRTMILSKILEFTSVVHKAQHGKHAKRSKKDNGMQWRSKEPMYVAQVSESTQKDNLRQATVRLVSMRVPEIADKFSTRAGQKGIVAIILPNEEMPVDAEGVSFDVICNEHYMPGRMTNGQQMESLGSAASLEEGKFLNATPFNPDSKFVMDLPETVGCRHFGLHTVYDGATGLAYDTQISAGYVYFLRLRHMVIDKEHSRSTGPETNKTGQPTEGRAMGGGLRFGEMERDCMIAHGGAQTLFERFMTSSDGKYNSALCRTCGNYADMAAPANTRIVNITHQKPYCATCKSNDNIVMVLNPTAFRVFVHYCRGMGIGVKLSVDEPDDDDEPQQQQKSNHKRQKLM